MQYLDARKTEKERECVCVWVVISLHDVMPVLSELKKNKCGFRLALRVSFSKTNEMRNLNEKKCALSIDDWSKTWQIEKTEWFSNVRKNCYRFKLVRMKSISYSQRQVCMCMKEKQKDELMRKNESALPLLSFSLSSNIVLKEKKLSRKNHFVAVVIQHL